MADMEHLDRFKEALAKQDVEMWNAWRLENSDAKPDLSGASLCGAVLPYANLSNANLINTNFHDADLSEAILSGARLNHANFSGANLHKSFFVEAHLIGTDMNGADLTQANLLHAFLAGVNLRKANLVQADLSWGDLNNSCFDGADLSEAKLQEANLRGAWLPNANLAKAYLFEANLSSALLSNVNFAGAYLHSVDFSRADLWGANLAGANITSARFVDTCLENANLTGCRIHGVSVWGVRLQGAMQSDLIISPIHDPEITVDNLEVAQFIYLLLNNQKIREVIDTITSKVVLILGNFGSQRKPVLDAIREKLRALNYLPVLFDFEKPTSRDLTETISTLAHMARFVIADITDARSIPHELKCIVPNLPSVPVQPLLLSSQQEYGMFEHIRRFSWVLEPVLYENQTKLLEEIGTKVIAPAEAKAREQTK
jgi:uncharacterized protein YjbI with pentapeptide repeats